MEGLSSIHARHRQEKSIYISLVFEPHLSRRGL